MQIDKDTILGMLKQQGRSDDAQKAAQELPDQVDTEKHAGLLSKYGLDPDTILDKLPGGLGDKIDDLPGGLGKKLGGLL
jgi:hypothetical protein